MKWIQKIVWPDMVDKATCTVEIGSGVTAEFSEQISSGISTQAPAEQQAENFATKNSCFLIGTRILMWNNKWKAIQDIEIGDLVRTKEGTNVPVLDSFIWNVDDMMRMYSNDNLQITDSHPMWIDNKWQTADKLNWRSKLMYVDNLYYLQTENNYITEGIPVTGRIASTHKGVSITKIGEKLCH